MLLETSVIDCIVVDLWESSVDANGGLFDNSTAYKIVDYYLTGVMVDYERENRYNTSKRSVESCSAHPYVFQSFCKSIKLKYMLEMFICGGLAFLF